METIIMIFLLLVLAIVINTVAGAIAWAFMDTEEGDVLNWLKEAPEPRAFSIILFLNMWSLFLYWKIRYGWENMDGEEFNPTIAKVVTYAFYGFQVLVIWGMVLAFINVVRYLS